VWRVAARSEWLHSSMNNILFVFGTRPEAIKLAPLILEFKRKRSIFNVRVCVTSQHREMLGQVLDFFRIRPDYDLDIMRSNQSVLDVAATGLKRIEEVLTRSKPDLVIVQGDTTSTFLGALASFYGKIRVAHIEAGLRSFNKYAPYPEETNRVLTSHIADFHFAPTKKDARNLRREGVDENVWVVGNTVVDALGLGMRLIQQKGEAKYSKTFSQLDFDRKILLVTGHRRESFGRPFENICRGLRSIVENFDDVEIVYPVHLNPNVRTPVKKILGGHSRIHLLEPLDYPHFIWLMSRAYLILTDSGGVQEEAPSLGKPVLVMRDVTERTEGIGSGTAKLVGTDPAAIIKAASTLLRNQRSYRRMSQAINPYGDGRASKRILEILTRELCTE